MTVEKLINKLQNYPEDSDVVLVLQHYHNIDENGERYYEDIDYVKSRRDHKIELGVFY